MLTSHWRQRTQRERTTRAQRDGSLYLPDSCWRFAGACCTVIIIIIALFFFIIFILCQEYRKDAFRALIVFHELVTVGCVFSLQVFPLDTVVLCRTCRLSIRVRPAYLQPIYLGGGGAFEPRHNGQVF